MCAVGQLAAGVAHDFNNLLTGIQGYAELALENAGGGTPAAINLRSLHGLVQRGARLTGQLLAFGRRQTLDVKVVSLNTVAERTVEMLQRLIGEHIETRFLPGTDVPLVWADAGQIEQVLTNLAINARDAMPDGGKLTIETTQTPLDEKYCEGRSEVAPGRYGLVTVTDSGCGISEELQRHIFEPFFTTKESWRRNGPRPGDCLRDREAAPRPCCRVQRTWHGYDLQGPLALGRRAGAT